MERSSRNRGSVGAHKQQTSKNSKNKQQQGFGRHMMVNAIERIILVSKHLGIIGFFVDAKNAKAKGYYQQFGFISFPDNPLELFLPIATLQRAYESILQK